jgi:hypothetical protein
LGGIEEVDVRGVVFRVFGGGGVGIYCLWLGEIETSLHVGAQESAVKDQIGFENAILNLRLSEINIFGRTKLK